MEITIDVDLVNNETTAEPYWLILDPKQMIKPDLYVLANMITGPFFSREEATNMLKAKRHHYSDRARVFCHSGYYTMQYKNAVREAEAKMRAEKLTSLIEKEVE